MSEYLEPYREAVEKLGPGFDSLLWRNRSFQEIRFKVLLEVAATGVSREAQLASVLRIENLTIADLGAGQADLAVWMHRIGLRSGGYIGVEGIPGLAQAAREQIAKINAADASVIEADFALESDLFESLIEGGADILLFSGSLNTFDEEAAIAVIERAYRAVNANKNGAVVFNFLSNLGRSESASEDTGPARRFDTLRLIKHFGAIAERIAFRQDYLRNHDATIGLFNTAE